MDRYIRMPDGRMVAIPEPVSPPEEAEEEEQPVAREGSMDDTSDLVSVSDEDIMGSEADNPKQELDSDDMDDLFNVTNEDIMGEKPKPRKPKLRFRRTSRPYYQPPSILGMR